MSIDATTNEQDTEQKKKIEVPVIKSEETSTYLNTKQLAQSDDKINDNVNSIMPYIVSTIITIILFLLLSIPAMNNIMINTFGEKSTLVKVFSSIIIANIGLYEFKRFSN